MTAEDFPRRKTTTSKGVGAGRPVPALQIYRLEIWNFAGVEHAKIEPQIPGVTVVHGPNESGKSTFVEAFQLLLNPNYRRDTQAKDVTKYKSKGKDLAFTVEADLRLGEYDLTMRKEFKKPGGQSILTIRSPRVENLSGNEAEDRFHELLADNVDLSLREALTVKQGDELGKVIPTTVTSLSGAMAETPRQDAKDADAEVYAGAMREPHSGGPQLFSDEIEELIFDEAQKVYGQYFTRSGRDSKEIREAEQAALQAQTEQVEAEQRYDKAVGLISSLETAKRERKKAREDRPGAEAAVEEASANLKKAESRDAQLKHVQSQVDVAKLNQENLQVAVQQRRELIDERDRASAKVSELTTAQETATAAVKKEEATLATVLAEVAKTRARLDATRLWHQVTQTVRGGIPQLQQLTREKALLTELAELQEQRQVAADELTRSVAPKVAQEVRDAVASYRAELRVLDSVSTQVSVSGPEGATFTENGHEIELSAKGHTSHLLSASTFTFKDFNVEIRPHQDRSDAQDNVRRCVKKLRTAATKAGLSLDLAALSDNGKQLSNGDRVSSTALEGMLSELSAQEATRSELEEKLRALESTIARRSSGRTSAEVEATIASLLTSIDAMRSDAEEQQQAAVELEADVALEFPGREVISRFVESNHARATALDVESHDQSTDNRDETASLVELSGSFDDDDLASLDEGTKNLRKLIDGAESAAQQAQNQREELAGTPHAIALERVSSELDVHKERLDTLDEQLAAQREKVGDDDVASKLEDAADKLARAQEAVRDMREQLQGIDTVEDAQLKLESATTARDNLARRERQLSEDIIAYSTELNNAATAKEDAEDAKLVAESATRKLAELRRKAAAAKLLLEELKKAREEKIAKYQAPFKEQFEALARYTFGPESEFSFDQDLRVSARVRGGLSLESGLLSGGAQEQIGLLTRLTVATLVGQGGGVPIILDDVLGFTDDERAEGMRLALGSVGRDHQIIVFTCAPERFEGVARAKVLSMAEAKRE